MPPQEVVDEIGYEITGPGYTFLEFALTAEMSTIASTSVITTSPTTYASSPASTSIYRDADYSLTAYGVGTTTLTYDDAHSRTATGEIPVTLSFDTEHSTWVNVQYVSSTSIAMSATSSPAASPTSIISASTSAYAPAYPTGLNSTSAAEASDGTSDGSDSAPTSKTSTVLKGVLGTIGALAMVLVLLFCIKRRRAKRRLRNDDPEMSQIVNAATTRPSVTHSESIDVVALPPPLARYSRIIDPTSAPSLPSRARSPRDRNSIVSSAWADGSEMDAFATDGSSIARTLSTHSNDSRATDATITTAENPFDHPAYTTLLSTSRRTRTTPTDTLLTASSPADPFSDGHAVPSHSVSTLPDSALSPISAVSPAVTMSRRSPADTLDNMFADMTDDDDSGHLSRGATIIRHVDAGSAPKGRQGQPEPEHIGGGEVHIPPTYMELYPRQGARLPR